MIGEEFGGGFLALGLDNRPPLDGTLRGTCAGATARYGSHATTGAPGSTSAGPAFCTHAMKALRACAIASGSCDISLPWEVTKYRVILLCARA